MIARCVVTERARLAVLEALLDQNLTAGNMATAREFNSLISSTTRRLCALVREHAAACAPTARPSVVVAHADQVTVDATVP